MEMGSAVGNLFRIADGPQPLADQIEPCDLCIFQKSTEIESQLFFRRTIHFKGFCKQILNL